MIKKLSYSLILGLMACAWLPACSDSNSDDGGSSSSTEFKVSKTEISYTKEGGTTEIYVQSDQTPTLTSDASWCTVSSVESSSASIHKYNITASANTASDDRQATVSVKAGTSSATISITQSSTESMVIATASYQVAAAGADITVTVSANSSYTYKSDVEWITEKSSRANMQDADLVFTVAANQNSVAREGHITFTMGETEQTVTVSQAAGEGYGDITADAFDIAPMMYPGWNLGNTLEASASTGKGSLSSETSWQSTKTTQQIIDYVKQQGFKSVRIPCSWDYHATDGVIDAAWMNRVKEVVDYCINDGLYVLLNDHWDGGWIEVLGFSESLDSYKAVSESTIQAKITLLKSYWTQIANEFAGYDEHLLFAGLNEPFQEYSLFNSRHEALTPILERYNQAFVDAVRATGGNNAKRILVAQGPSTSISSACDDYFSMPTDLDGQTGRLMCEVHYYEPWDFCGSTDGSVLYWGSSNHASDHNATWGEESWTTTQMSKIYSKFYQKGYPVIIGEYGANWRDVSSISGNQTKHDASVKAWFSDITSKAIANGAVPFVWDTNSTNRNGLSGTMAIINRQSLSVFCTPALEGIQEAVASAKWPD